ncbi:hypothetical protein [Maricaulis maris]|uniref:hypothetical protein n=1 Tax=Maricaulis maris TaxID=74318 RepID=UPI003A9553D8
MNFIDWQFQHGSFLARLSLFVIAVAAFIYAAGSTPFGGVLPLVVSGLVLALAVYSLVRLRRSVALSLLVLAIAVLVAHAMGISSYDEHPFEKYFPMAWLVGCFLMNDDVHGVFR